MQEIKCPKCGEVFVVDESGYAQIVQQIRDKEFEKELKRREEDLEEKKNSDLEIIRMQQKEELKGRLKNSETEKELAVSSAVQKKEQEISAKINRITELEGQLSSKENENKLKEENLQKQYEDKLKLKEEQI